MRDTSRRARRWLVAVAAVFAVAPAGCEFDSRPRRRPARVEPDFVFDAGVVTPDGGFPVPTDGDPAVVESAPVELGLTQCPELRMVRVDRRHAGAPPTAPPLRPRFYGRDSYGRYAPLLDVLACELRVMSFVPKFSGEGEQMVLLRGPEIFAPDADCEWREPVRTERDRLGRTMYARERCRRGAARTERGVVVFIPEAYAPITVRYVP